MQIIATLISAVIIHIFALTSTPVSAATLTESQTPPKQFIKTILTTDLTASTDNDDWNDVLSFLTLKNINPAGIIIDTRTRQARYAYALMPTFLSLTNHTNVPVFLGSPSGIEYDSRGSFTIGDDVNDTAANFILDTMRKHHGRVRIIVVGDLRDVAIAYLKNPVLFMNKIEYVYISAGRVNFGRNGGSNFTNDPEAARLIVNSSIPIVYVQNSPKTRGKLTGVDERYLANLGDASRAFKKFIHNVVNMDDGSKSPKSWNKRINKIRSEITNFSGNKVANFITVMTALWRKQKGDKFFWRTRQMHYNALVEDERKGQNIWSIGGFLRISGVQNNPLLSYKPGKLIIAVSENDAHCIDKDIKCGDEVLFDFGNANGSDFILDYADKYWITQKLLDIFEVYNH